VARSRSLFVATLPLILRLAAYIQVRLTPQDFACLRVAASAKAGTPCIWAFLISLKKMSSSTGSEGMTQDRSLDLF